MVTPLLVLCMMGTTAAVAGPTASAEEASPVTSAPTVSVPRATATTWPHWRGGPHQTGRVPGTLDLDTLTRRWTLSADGPILGSAVVDEHRVYVGTKAGTVLAVDRTTGEVGWRHATEGPVEGAGLRVGDVLVIGSRDGRIRALSARDGTVRWTVDARAEVTAAPAYLPDPPSVVVGAYDGTIHRLALDDGRSLWTHTTGSYVVGSAASVGPHTVVGACDGRVYTLDAATGTPVATVEVGAYVGSAVALDGGTGFTGHFDHQVIAFDPATGAIGWSHRDRSFPYLSSPALTDNLLFLGGRDRRLHALERASGQPAWWGVTGGRVDSSPVVVGDTVLAGSDDGRLYAWSTDGELRRAFEVGGSIAASPAVASGWLWIGSDDGILHAFGPPAAPPPSATESR